MKNKNLFLGGIRVFTLFLLILVGIKLSAQVQNKVDFKLRTSVSSPGGMPEGGIYKLRGDFLMIGNANLYDSRQWGSGTPSENNSNNTRMSFHKLAGDPAGIINSSSAVLTHPTGFSKDCSKIVYAGLYWSGRGNNGPNLTLENGLVKNKVKIKLPGQTSYKELTANGIHFGDSHVDGIYSAYVDITQEVRDLANAWGTYAVADVAATTGNGSSVGYYGGWGMVIIYENPTMKWRDITMFDGYSYIAQQGSGTTYGELAVSGFRAAQNGAVNVKMGMMAGEGDKGIDGDVFDIRSTASSGWTRLKHNGNATDNFFNSSINTGGNTRTPNYTNNYGLDISMFDLPNSDNSIIKNGQDNTRFRFGTSGDTYVIYNIVFAVDAYVPEVEAHNVFKTTGLVDNKVTPGQMLDFTLDVRNKGTEAINNGKIEIPLPNNVYFQSADPSRPGQAPQIAANTSVQWRHPDGSLSNGPAAVAGGTIVWTIGNIPLSSADKNKILGTLNYRLKVTDNCTVLTTGAGGCGLEIPINGTVTGIGATSTNLVNNTLVKEYGTGNCAGPIYNDFLVTINAAGLNCPDVVNGRKQFKAECGSTVVKFDVVKAEYPVGTKFYSALVGTTPTNEVTTDFPASAGGVEKTTYYAVVPGAAEGCYLVLETQSTCCDVNIFYEDFGKSPLPTDANDFGRMKSPYMPEGSFIFGTPYPKSNVNDQTMIDNNHYAVVAPGYIKSGSDPQNMGWYFWTPASNESNTVQDRSGTVDGAVMVINAGTTLKAFYTREATLEKGVTYRASFWMYLVKGQSEVSVDIRDENTGAVIGTAKTGPLYDGGEAKGKWVKYDFHFKVPANIDCDISNVVVEYRNNHPATDGNDYYIDDISFAKVDPNCAPTEGVIDLTCPVVKAQMTLEKVGVFVDANSNGYAEKGERITYTFKITNTGNVSLSNMELVDPLLGGVVTADFEEENSNSHIVYKNGKLDKDEIWFVTVTYPLTNADIRKNQVYNKATVTGTAPAGTTVTVDDDVTVTFKGLSLIITNPMLPSKAR